MTDPDVRKCRSLVLEIGTNNIVCVSPFKSDCLDYFTENIQQDVLCLHHFSKI